MKEGRHICIFDKCTCSFDRMRELQRHINDDHASDESSDGEGSANEDTTKKTVKTHDTESKIKSTAKTSIDSMPVPIIRINQLKKRKRTLLESNKEGQRVKPIKTTSKKAKRTNQQQQVDHHYDGDFTTPHCICRRPDDGKGMIECSSCQEWYHYFCVGLTKRKATAYSGDVEYECPRCTNQKNKNKAAKNGKTSKDRGQSQNDRPKSPSKIKRNKTKEVKAMNIGRQRVSGMSATELAHLCLKLQDRINALERSLKDTKQNLKVTKQVYKGKTEEERKACPYVRL